MSEDILALFIPIIAIFHVALIRSWYVLVDYRRRRDLVEATTRSAMAAIGARIEPPALPGVLLPGDKPPRRSGLPVAGLIWLFVALACSWRWSGRGRGRAAFGLIPIGVGAPSLIYYAVEGASRGRRLGVAAYDLTALTVGASAARGPGGVCDPAPTCNIPPASAATWPRVAAYDLNDLPSSSPTIAAGRGRGVEAPGFFAGLAAQQSPRYCGSGCSDSGCRQRHRRARARRAVRHRNVAQPGPAHGLQLPVGAAVRDRRARVGTSWSWALRLRRACRRPWRSGNSGWWTLTAVGNATSPTLPRIAAQAPGRRRPPRSPV